jgi:hypothetical protein
MIVVCCDSREPHDSISSEEPSNSSPASGPTTRAQRGFCHHFEGSSMTPATISIWQRGTSRKGGRPDGRRSQTGSTSIRTIFNPANAQGKQPEDRRVRRRAPAQALTSVLPLQALCSKRLSPCVARHDVCCGTSSPASARKRRRACPTDLLFMNPDHNNGTVTPVRTKNF